MYDWKKYFMPAIIARGQKYYFEKRIREIRQNQGIIYATVSGTNDYIVELDPESPDGQYGICNCPYAMNGSNCKHMAAVLIALEDGAIAYDPAPSVRVEPIDHIRYELPWLEAIDQLPEAILRKELMRLADQSDYLQERISILNSNGLPDGLLTEWRTNAYLMTDEYADHRGYIDRHHSDEFSSELCDFMELKLPLLIKLQAVEDAFALVQMIGDAAKRRPFYEVDQGEFIYIAEQCKQSIDKIKAIADDGLKKKMEQWYKSFFQGKKLLYHFPKYVVRFIDQENPNIPYYRQARSKEEWKVAPKADSLYYDPIENHPLFERINRIVYRKAQARIGNRFRGMGTCHLLWQYMKEIFKEEYGINWHSPAKMNPSCYFD